MDTVKKKLANYKANHVVSLRLDVFVDVYTNTEGRVMKKLILKFNISQVKREKNPIRITLFTKCLKHASI